MSEGNLRIYYYEDPKASKKGEKGSFTVDFNPNTFTINNKLEYTQADSKGTDGGDPVFDKIPPLEFTIEFTIDGTGVAFNSLTPANQNTFKSQQDDKATKHDYVKKQIQELKDVFGSTINGEIHRPNYLTIVWGNILIECVLTSLQIVYTLFDKEGSPLRAKLTCGFRERISNAKDTKSSPDLTKIKYTRDGDSLLLIANEKYDLPDYYLQIAKVNKLKNFRKLKPGTKIVLPPMIEK